MLDDRNLHKFFYYFCNLMDMRFGYKITPLKLISNFLLLCCVDVLLANLNPKCCFWKEWCRMILNEYKCFCITSKSSHFKLN